jgi:hypothetical protein
MDPPEVAMAGQAAYVGRAVERYSAAFRDRVLWT